MALFNYECDEVKRKIQEVSPNYPQLTTYEKEWLYFHKYGYIPGVPVELEYETVSVNPTGSVSNAIPFRYKSAILKGNTLVNYAQITSHNFDEYRTPIQNLNKPLEKGKSYTIIMNIVSQTVTSGITTRFVKDNEVYIGVRTFNGVGLHKYLYTATDDFNQFAPYVNIEEYQTGLSAEYNQLMILEGDYTSVDIPFFEGMQSVKMPVLTTTGKNLFDVEVLNDRNNKVTVNNGTVIIDNYYSNQLGNWREIFGFLKPNSTYFYSCDLTYDGGSEINEFTGGFFLCKTVGDSVTFFRIPRNKAFTTPSDLALYDMVIIYGATSNDGVVALKNTQFTESSVVTEYEPYKSNILTVNEDVTLRGLGDVQDTLDLLTGEVTERIGEIVLDGNRDYTYTGNHVANDEYATFHTDLEENQKPSPNWDISVSDKMEVSNEAALSVFTKECVYPNYKFNVVYIRVKKSHLVEVSPNGFKKWIADNVITLQYKLATESVKTVALTPLNNPYEGTNHYELSSNIPCEVILDVPVVSTGKQTLEEINN